MTWLEFWAQFVSAVSWPLVALIAVVFLRKEIKSAANGIIGRIGEMQRIEFPGGSIDFDEKTKEVAREIEAATQSDAAPTVAIEPRQDEEAPAEAPRQKAMGYQDIAESNPKAAILVAFADLEGLLRRTFARLYPNEKSPASYGLLVGRLQADKRISDELAESLLDLADLRNQVAHGQVARIDNKTAITYVDSIGNVLVYLTQTDMYK